MGLSNERRVNARLRILLVAFIALGFGGCIGDDGSDGVPGPAGPPGPPGPSGGPSGSGLLADAERIDVTIGSVDIDADGMATVSLTLANESAQGLAGLPAANISFVIAQLSPGTAGGSSAWQSYTTTADDGVDNAQAGAESAASGTFTDNGDGSYTYTFASSLHDYPAAPTYDVSKTHRVGVEVRTNRNGFLPENTPANNAPYDFVPAGGTPAFTRLIADNATCNACHDNLELHGEARFDVAYCVQCHNPASIDINSGNSVDMTIMTHKIHYGAELANGYQVFGFFDILHDYSDVVFSQDVRNCTTCHREDNPDLTEAANWRTVANRNACGSCHDGIVWDSATEGHPGGFAFVDDTQCLDCHGPGATVNGGTVQTAKAHEIPEDIAEGLFSFNVLDITDTAAGEFPVVTFSVTDPTSDDAAYDIAASPEFTACADGTSRLAVLIGWTSDDFTNRDTGNGPGQPISINPLSGPGCGGTVTDNLDGTYSVTSTVPVPASVSGTLIAALEGHPWVDINEDGEPSRSERIAVKNGFMYAGIAGAEASPRRDIVAIEKCNDCHSRLELHGNNRSDRPEVCVICHNGNATDVNRRSGDCVDAFGDDDVSIDMKTMVHALHASGETGVPYDVCGFGNRPVSIDFKYPGRLNNCEGCHLPDTYYPVDQALVLSTSIDASDNTLLPDDDTVVSPNSAVCSTCHTSALAAEHMTQNGGNFDAMKALDSTLISSGVETCALCHGPGRSSDVKTVHGIGTFGFN